MLNNQKKLLLIESFILSFPMMLVIGLFLVFTVFSMSGGFDEAESVTFLSFCAFLVLILLLPNILFYMVLRNKLSIGVETFLYSIGFLSNVISYTVIYSILNRTGIPASGKFFSFLLIALLFVSLFYAYAAVLKTNEKGNRKIALFLMMIAIVFFVILTIKDFEILNLKENYEFFIFAVLPVLYGLYIGHYTVYTTTKISLCSATWAPFLLIVLLIFVNLLASAILYPSPPEIMHNDYVITVILFLLISFIFSCLAGAICKHFQKNQNTMQTNE
ncbi:MAG: hypothetical protein LBU81_04635 [Methanosarcinales archaeon]|nr:hypothetical protein [Methanosarcinales archaeon]